MKRYFLAPLASLLVFCATARGSEGVTIRGGGDDVGLEFTVVLQLALKEIRENHPDLAAQIAPHALEELAKKLQIYVVNEPLQAPTSDGLQESVALNEPATGRIWVNRARWRQIYHPRILQAIALHEVLSLQGAEGTGRYPISSAFLARFSLRNDESVFLQGADPALPHWKNLRSSCETNSAFRNEATGVEHKLRRSALEARATWSVLGTSYGLSFLFGSEVEGRGNYIPKLRQARSRVLQQTEDGTVIRTNGRVLGFENDRIREMTEGDFDQLETPEQQGRSESWAWKNGRKGEKVLVHVSSRLADGSMKHVTENLMPITVPQMRKLYSVTECVSKNLGAEEWIALAGVPQFGVEVDKINTQALLVYEADRQHRACAGDGCRATQAALGREVNAFERVWDQVFQRQKNRMEEELRAQRKPARRPTPRPRSRANSQSTGPVAKEPTFIRAPDGGSPILRMPGQSLRLSRQEQAFFSQAARAKRKLAQ